MKLFFYITLFFIIFFQACEKNISQNQIEKLNTLSANNSEKESKQQKRINPGGKTLLTRILPPSGYERIIIEDNSFAHYLRILPLKPHGSLVKYYNGSTKPNNNIYDAVINLEIGNKDIHQCADAIMRLRAKYLWDNKKYDEIHFNFTNGFRVDYNEWMKGKRIVVKGNSSYWKQTKKPSNTYKDFWNYMEVIFYYAGTLSLSKELNYVDVKEMQIGDIFIHGGSPGHAVIVVDLAIDKTANKKVFLLAQSYMPAQEIQLLKNPNDKTLTPWYSTDFGYKLVTPEWQFKKTELKRFAE